MTESLVLFLAGQVLTACGVYAAIRADLREALVRVALLEKRLDNLAAVPCRNA